LRHSQAAHYLHLGKSCSTCRLFSPTTLGKGQCAIVDGDVSPNVWCIGVFAERLNDALSVRTNEN
jgi:hypothetical protein